MDQIKSKKPVLRWLPVKILVVVMLLGLIVGVQASLGGSSALAASHASNATTSMTQAAQPAATITWVRNCGIFSCSIYFSRHTTVWIANNGVPAVIGLGFIPVIGKYLAGAAGIIIWKAGQARSKHQCLRLRYVTTLFGASIVGFYSDGSKYCKN